MSSLRWIEGPLCSNTKQKDLVYVVYAPLNFRDIMLTTGKRVSDMSSSHSRFDKYTIGLEYVGVDTAGRRVMGLSENR